MEGCLELFPFTEGHAGEFFLEAFLFLRVAGAQKAVHEFEEALFVPRHHGGPDQDCIVNLRRFVSSTPTVRPAGD